MDVASHGRYWKPHRQFAHRVQEHLPNKANCDAALAKYGINQEGEIFKSAFPLLDPFSGFPIDPMHCELRLAKYYHEGLVTDYLSKAGLEAYTSAWQTIKVPFGW